jgi:hypothetical protein
MSRFFGVSVQERKAQDLAPGLHGRSRYVAAKARNPIRLRRKTPLTNSFDLHPPKIKWPAKKSK